MSRSKVLFVGVVLLFCLGSTAEAQRFKFQPFNPLLVQLNNDTLSYPFVGGMRAPIIQQDDVNGNGL